MELDEAEDLGLADYYKALTSYISRFNKNINRVNDALHGMGDDTADTADPLLEALAEVVISLRGLRTEIGNGLRRLHVIAFEKWETGEGGLERMPDAARGLLPGLKRMLERCERHMKRKGEAVDKVLTEVRRLQGTGGR